MMMFTAIDWPPTCYVQEGAYWLALGRVPQIYYGDEEVDARLDQERRWAGNLAEYDPGFSEAEFRWIGHPIDYKRYEVAPYILESEHFQRILDEAIPLRDEDPEEVEAWKRGMSEKYQEEKIEAAWREDQDRVFDSCVDEARVEIYQALSKGELRATGWLVFPDGELNEEGPPGRFVDIEQHRWSFRNFDWEKSTLRSGADEFLAVQVETGDLLARFPRPAIEPLTLTVLAYPHGLVISDDIPENTHRAARSPGRPPKAGGVIRSVVQNYFGHQLRKGREIKREALIQEVIDFVAVTFPDEKIVRSTAQEYLNGIQPTGVKDALIHAKTGAGNSAGK